MQEFHNTYYSMSKNIAKTAWHSDCDVRSAIKAMPKLKGYIKKTFPIRYVVSKPTKT